MSVPSTLDIRALNTRPSPAGCVYKVREWLCEWDERDQGFSKVMSIVDGQLERGERTSLQPMTALSQVKTPRP
jgi:hypothetical protein